MFYVVTLKFTSVKKLGMIIGWLLGTVLFPDCGSFDGHQNSHLLLRFERILNRLRQNIIAAVNWNEKGFAQF